MEGISTAIATLQLTSQNTPSHPYRQHAQIAAKCVPTLIRWTQARRDTLLDLTFVEKWTTREDRGTCGRIFGLELFVSKNCLTLVSIPRSEASCTWSIKKNDFSLDERVRLLQTDFNSFMVARAHPCSWNRALGDGNGWSWCDQVTIRCMEKRREAMNPALAPGSSDGGLGAVGTRLIDDVIYQSFFRRKFGPVV